MRAGKLFLKGNFMVIHRLHDSTISAFPSSGPTRVPCPPDGFCLGTPEDNAKRHVTDMVDDFMETLPAGAQIRLLQNLRADLSARLRVLEG